MDIPPSRNRVNPKTCCGRMICRCVHPKGGFCAFRAKAQAAAAHTHHSHAQHEVLPVSQSVAFTKAPCHTEAPKTAMTGHSVEFNLVSLKGLSVHPHQAELYFNSFSSPRLISLPAADPPPKLFFF